jgi:hypothetical protein
MTFKYHSGSPGSGSTSTNNGQFGNRELLVRPFCLVSILVNGWAISLQACKIEHLRFGLGGRSQNAEEGINRKPAVLKSIHEQPGVPSHTRDAVPSEAQEEGGDVPRQHLGIIRRLGRPISKVVSVEERQVDLGLRLKGEAFQLFVVDSGDKLQKAPGTVEVEVDDLAEVLHGGMHEGANKAAGMEVEAADRPTKRGPDAAGIKRENGERGQIRDG